MPLAPLAVTDDVSALLGRSLAPDELTGVLRLLTMASGVVRRYTRQLLTFVANDTATLPGSWGASVSLPQRPVTAVHSVTVNGRTLEPGAYQWDRDGELSVSSGSFAPDYGSAAGGSALWGPAGSIGNPTAGGPSWSGPSAVITVSYDHGFDEIPQDVVNEVAGMVASQIATPMGILKEDIGGYKVAYQRSAGGGMTLTADAKSMLNFFRKRTASVSVTSAR